MDHEKNANSIRELDKQIGELERTIAQLKQTRNSLLNITTLIPPEILGKIFCLSQTTSYNFLFVCHHLFEVASHTPELWSSWGKTLRDWERRYACFGIGPLDFELEHTRWQGQLDGPLLDTVRDRAARDLIRQISLKSDDPDLLNSIISAITVDGLGLRMESFTVHNDSDGESTVDLSDLFLRHRLPALRCLRLSGRCQISSWDCLGSRTTGLTTLSLKIEKTSSTPNTSQLLSILSSNPNLQHLELPRGMVPDCDGSTLRVSLPSLKRLQLKGHSRTVLGLLNMLELPDKMDEVRFFLDECSRSDLSQTLGQYLGALIRRRGSFQEGLGLRIHPGESRFHIFAGDVTELHGSIQVDWFAVVGVAITDGMPQGEEAGQLCSTLIERLPLNEAVLLQTTIPVLTLEGPCVAMSNLVRLRLEYNYGPALSTTRHFGEFRAHSEPFPSLRYLWICPHVLDPEDWDPFVAFLSRRASVGKRIVSLVMETWPDIPIEEEEEKIRNLVEDLKIEDPDF